MLHLGPPHPYLVGLPPDGDLLREPLLEAAPFLPGELRGFEGLEHFADLQVPAPYAPPEGLRRMGCQHELRPHAVQHLLQRTGLHALAFEARESARQRSPLRRVARGRLVLAPPPHPVVSLRDVDELEVHREGPDDPLELLRVHTLDLPPEPLVQRGVVIEAQPLAKEPNLLLSVEETLAFLLDKDLAKHPPEQIYVTPKRLVLGLEADPGRQIRILRLRRRRGLLADIHRLRVTLPRPASRGSRGMFVQRDMCTGTKEARA